MLGDGCQKAHCRPSAPSPPAPPRAAGTTFEGANLAGAVFEDALIGSEDAKRLCGNPTLKGDSRNEVGCRQ